ncbi:hypothetical protein FRC03_002257 [Tulasnella sp. 419]|nr:hypothetical protein FRC02_002982 [Tulasnella sp. 418]KAG8964052.1 hypothetical protein FRC03_002257 [Tulasnella sp. 419]
MPAPSEFLPNIVDGIYPDISPDQFIGTNKGRVVFITGASKGLGLASATAYAQTGASLFISARNTTALKALKEELESKYSVPVAYAGIDVASEESVKAGVDAAVALYGKIDIVISNAGGGEASGPIGGPGAPSVSKWWECQELNLRGSYMVTHYTIPELIKSKGYIIYLSSALANIRLPGGSAYNMAKLSLIRLAEWVHLSHNESGVKAISIHPGAVQTDLGGGLVQKVPSLAAVFKDSPELSAWTEVRLTSGSHDWLSGRYYDSNWTFATIDKLKEKIIEEDALKLRLALPQLN